MPVIGTRYLAPNEIATRFGVKPAKVIAWIQSGELKAFDAATKRGGKPRYKISLAALELFEASRSIVPPVATAPRRRHKPVIGMTDHFAKA